MARRTGTAKAKAKATLRPRLAAFVREYVGAGCKNAKQAAIRAGYAGGASEVTASRLLDNPKVAAEIEKAQGRLSHVTRYLRIASCAKSQTSRFVTLWSA
jgi:phage terminase small subunit